MLGKKGKITSLFNEFKNVPNEQKREFGQKINQLKTKALDKVNELKNQLDSDVEFSSGMDLTAPAANLNLGSRHPLSIVRNEIIEIWKAI